MTTTAEPLLTPPSDADDPFRYGWRYTKRIREDGFDETVLVPLTVEDLLHPEEGDHVTHSEAHQRRRRYLCNVFEARLLDDASAYVLDDVRVKWDAPDVKPHGPDIAIVRGVREHRNWSTFDVAEEGVLPDLIVEITSPETADIDRSRKLDEYDFAGLPTYVIVDGVNGKHPTLRLVGYTRKFDQLVIMRSNDQGWLWLDAVQVWIGVVDNELACFDRDGQLVLNYADVVAAMDTEQQRAAEAEQRAAAAEQRAADSEARLRTLEAEIQRLRGQ